MAIAERLPRELFEAIADSPEQANELQAIEEASIQSAEAIEDAGSQFTAG